MHDYNITFKPLECENETNNALECNVFTTIFLRTEFFTFIIPKSLIFKNCIFEGIDLRLNEEQCNSQINSCCLES